jgi:1-phosphofructokinase
VITTITINPAIDRTLITENFLINSINRTQSVRIDAGGKGINASKIIHHLDFQTICLGVLGGASGKELVDILNLTGLKNDFVWVSEPTRINTKIVDIKNNTCTDINEKGPYLLSTDVSKLRSKIYEFAHKSQILILSGNVQDSVPSTIYKDIMDELKQFDIKIILDSSGQLLKNGIEGKPWLIKPNISEFSELIGREFSSTEDIISEAVKLNNFGIKYVCVSMGERGLLLVTKESAILAQPPKILAKNTVGAGDFTVGSLAVSLLKNESLETTIKLACAIGAASVTLLGTEVPSQEMIDDMYTKVKVFHL